MRGRTVLKLDKGHQELLFEIRPETFQRCPVATNYWSYVDLDGVDDEELAALVLEAWSNIVPKKISRPLIEAAAAGRTSRPAEDEPPA